MRKILLLSDTHSDLDEFILNHIKGADEVWHAGDVGSLKWIDDFKFKFPSIEFRGVYGNIDDNKLRTILPLVNNFEIEGVKVTMLHIAGSFSKLNKDASTAIDSFKPKLFICGHSHILKVQYNKQRNFLFLNPGAAGNHGFHQFRTMLKFDLNEGEIQNLCVIEKKRGILVNSMF